MILIMIENRNLLSKIVSYFDHLKIKYTTNPNAKYDYFMIAELNQRITEKIKENITSNKKIIFITYLEEHKIIEFYKSKSIRANIYNNLLSFILKKSYLVIVSLPAFKDILKKYTQTKIKVIEKENPKLIKFRSVKFSKNTCLIIDKNYSQLEQINSVANNFPKIKFQILGYIPDYSLSFKNINIINNLPPNIEVIKSCDLFSFIEQIIKNNIVVYTENDIRDYSNLLYLILLKNTY